MIVFSDLPLNPDASPSDLATNLDAVRNGFRMMIDTDPGTCLMGQSGYGCNLNRYVFDTPNRTLAVLIANEIERGAKRWCPDIDLPRNNINVEMRPDGDGYNVVCQLNVPALGIVSNVKFSILR